MSLQDRLGNANALSMLTLAASLALATTNGPHRYNFSLMLFGIIAHELTSSSNPLRIFISFVFFTAIFDLYYFVAGAAGGGLSTLFALIVLILKVPIFFSCTNTLRERGGEMNWNVPNLQSFQGFGGRGGGNEGGGGIPQGSTVWSMPGGFSGGGGGGGNAQQTQPARTQNAPSGNGFPAGGGFRLGGDEDDSPAASGNAPSAPPPGKNGYSSIA